MIKVTNIRCHVGAQIGAQVYNSLDAKKDRVEMHMTSVGVFVTGGMCKQPYFIPHGTIASVALDTDSFCEFMQKEEPKEEAKKKSK